MKTLTINCENISPMHLQGMVAVITNYVNKKAYNIAADLSDWPEDQRGSKAGKEMETWQKELREIGHLVQSQYNNWVYKRY